MSKIGFVGFEFNILSLNSLKSTLLSILDLTMLATDLLNNFLYIDKSLN